MLAATASFINCTGGVNGDLPTEITRSDIDGIIKTLKSNSAYTITDNIEGADKFGSAPVRDGFMALCSTDLIGQVDAVSGFLSKAQYPSPMNALESEWGSVSNIRFVMSPIGSQSANASALGNTVYNIFCTGMDSYCNVEQNQYSAQFIYLPPQFSGPLAMNSSVGYKMAMVPRITNDLWLLNLRATILI
jgi:N4-gp56 family major capsid protein